jgi:NitT/TauT family transport system permease protein
MGRWQRKTAILLFWLILWQIVSAWINKPIYLVGPMETLQALLHLAGSSSFWRAVWGSLARIGVGFGLASMAGLLMGSAAHFVPFIKELLSPLVSLMKTVPVASFVILALIWAGAEQLALVISFVVVFPMIYLNTISGLEATDPQLLEMARVFRVRPWSRLWQIYRPAMAPYLLSACQVALGMSWKSGIAAEVIGTPEFSIGENLYMAKVFFSTDELFAWTAVVIVLSFLFERGILWVLRQIFTVKA